MSRRIATVLSVLILFCGVVPSHAAVDKSATAANNAAQSPPGAPRPNILFIILDDVGIDQMRIFGYGGLTKNSAPNTPNIDVVARHGVRFRNTWAMPECSPSRVMFFQGRFPLRTNTYSALLNIDVAKSERAPY